MIQSIYTDMYALKEQNGVQNIPRHIWSTDFNKHAKNTQQEKDSFFKKQY